MCVERLLQNLPLEECWSCRGMREVFFGEYDSFSRPCTNCNATGKAVRYGARKELIDRALDARAKWMREQFYERVVREHLLLGWHRGAEIDSPIKRAIDALPLRPPTPREERNE